MFEVYREVLVSFIDQEFKAVEAESKEEAIEKAYQSEMGWTPLWKLDTDSDVSVEDQGNDPEVEDVDMPDSWLSESDEDYDDDEGDYYFEDVNHRQAATGFI